MTGVVADVGTVVDVVKATMSLFTEFPLNIMIAAMVGGIGLRMFGKASRVTK